MATLTMEMVAHVFALLSLAMSVMMRHVLKYVVMLSPLKVSIVTMAMSSCQTAVGFIKKVAHPHALWIEDGAVLIETLSLFVLSFVVMVS